MNAKQKLEIKFGDFEAITRQWLFEPEARASIEQRFAEIGIIAKGVDMPGGGVYLDVTIPENIYIEAPQHCVHCDATEDLVTVATTAIPEYHLCPECAAWEEEMDG